MDKDSNPRRSLRKNQPPSRLNYSINFNQKSSSRSTFPNKDVIEQIKSKLNSTKKTNNQVRSNLEFDSLGREPPKRDSDRSDKLFGPSDKSFSHKDSNFELSSCDPNLVSNLNLSENFSSATSNSTNQTKMGDNEKNMEKVFQLINDNNAKLMSEMMKKMSEMILNQQSNSQSESNGNQEKELLHSNSRLNQREALKIHPWLSNVRQFDSAVTKMPTDCSKIADLTLIQSVICWIRKNGTGLTNHQKFLMLCIESIPNHNSLKSKPDESFPSILSRTMNWVDVEMSDDASKNSTTEAVVKSMINDVKISMVSERSSVSFQNQQQSFSGFAKPSRHYDKASKNSRYTENYPKPPQPCFSWNDGKCKYSPNCSFVHVCTKCWKKGKICRKRRSECDGEGPDSDSREE